MSCPEPKIPALCLDIETGRGATVREIGVWRADTDESLRISGTALDLVARLDDLSEGARFVLGHNILAFDLPRLAASCPELALLRLPRIDTLLLSPIAFPHNPYHRLVKDYKLAATTRNDPVQDAKLAFALFLEERSALQTRHGRRPDETLCLHHLLVPEGSKDFSSFFAQLRGALRPQLEETRAAWTRATAGQGCLGGQRYLLENWLTDPDWHRSLAFVLAWLQVAGGNSVLPPWVGQTYPRTREIVARLRDTPCADPDCAWCRAQHDLPTLLPRLFPGIRAFRPTPATKDGRSLQQAIVENGFAGRSTLAILPTGGGKSLCFQLPALARYFRTGSLTVVISPLQSLMKDQVDNLEARGIVCAGYLNGLLTPLERQAMLTRLRQGDLGLIFVAPEQFRGATFVHALKCRQIAAWVFDEAHCLSKWGHDFRPDYLYVARFIRAWQGEMPSPFFCFTATAKPQVVEDIVTHFAERLDIRLATLTGGVRRDNLVYEVRAVPATAKFAEALRLLKEEAEEGGGAIVFCARQKTVEELAAFLIEAGLACGFFHGGMASEKKRAVQEAFLTGKLQVIVATNAFGMGVDKPDVRLVIHLDTPSSLENYLQEAGRAGRDQAPARCLLLYDEADLDVQFRLLKNAQLSQQDISSILRALRQIEKKHRGGGKGDEGGDVVVTSGEILFELPETTRLDPEARDVDTRIRITVAWLEEAKLLERRENHVRLFPGSLLVGSAQEALAILRRKLPRETPPEPYLKILDALFLAADDEGVSTDALMLAVGCDASRLQRMLRELDRWRLLSDDVEIGVQLYGKQGKDGLSSELRLQALSRLENALVARLQEEAPDADTEHWQVLNLRKLCDRLRRDCQGELTPDGLSRLLKSFAVAFGEGVAQRGFFEMRPEGREQRRLRLKRAWREIDDLRQKRLRVAWALMRFLQEKKQGNALLVTCKQRELLDHLEGDLTLQDADIRDGSAALAAALLYLDANEVWRLTRGKTVFRSAMHIHLNDEARRRRFGKSDYVELAVHYRDKTAQVHVMAEYARLALDKMRAAMRFVEDYFTLERSAFLRRHFAGRKDMLEMATTETAHRRILVELKNPAQQAIVGASEENLLVLAGPGSGKTRVIVHRIAWLLREHGARPEEILALAFNRFAAVEIRRRLWALVGAEAAGVGVHTLHGLALRLTGTSCAVAAELGESVDFDALIRHAAASLKRTLPAEDEDDDGRAALKRDRLLAGLRFLLVDEYQDINGDHYELISALAGRTLRHAEDKLTLLVVGDDDQNIYAFNDASVRYIRQFEQDYAPARRCYLVENYRSTAHIIACANRVIARGRERMKAGQEIRVDDRRCTNAAGGAYAALDPVARGRVQVLQVPADPALAAEAALCELARLVALGQPPEAPCRWGRFAVIARAWRDLETLAALCRARNIPVRMLGEPHPPALHTTREGADLLALLRGERRRSRRARPLLREGLLARWFKRRYGLSADQHIEHPWQAMLAQFILDHELPGLARTTQDAIEALHEFGAGQQAVSDRPHGPLTLLTAHRAKGLEFEHVLIADGGSWQQNAEDEERRLFYVAMTRARQTLTVCQSAASGHAFIRDFADLALFSAPQRSCTPVPLCKTWRADERQIVLSWPGHFPALHPLHAAIAALEVGTPLQLRPRSNDQPGWELADADGVTVGRMARKFIPPKGEIVAVRVFAILSRRAKKPDEKHLRCPRWELVLPEIDFR